jgi:hypothetical protein
MDKKEWNRVEAALKSCPHLVQLDCDGFKVDIWLVHKSLCKLLLTVVGINGWMKGRWTMEDCEERRRFFYPYKKFVYSSKSRTKAKRMPKKYKEIFNRAYKGYSSVFPGIAAMRRHFEENNKSISVIYPKDTEARETA